jgi:DNA modification methylase
MNEIIEGDGLEYIKLLSDNSIDCIYTDVPYLYDCGGGGSSEIALRISKLKKEDLANLNIIDGFDIIENMREWMRVMKKVNMFVWCSKLQIYDILTYVRSWAEINDKEIYNEILVWVKTNPTPSCNNTWLPDVEYCLYFREKGVKLNDGYFHKQKAYISGINVKDKASFKHPTIKPLECVKNHLLHTTQANDIVLDMYAGSFTTCVAAKELGRRYIGIEISKEYCDIGRKRLENTQTYSNRSLI